MRSVKVWDLPTRLFHWALVASVLLAYFTSSGRPRGFLFGLHLVGGYGVVLLLIFRLAWGIFGGEHARFASFLKGWGAVKEHAQRLAALSPGRALGHNPLGGWMIMLMLATLVAVVATGLLAQAVPGGAGPLSGMLPASLVRPVGAAHEWLGTAILFLAGLHVAGVIGESLLNRENLVRAMITGRKYDESAPDAHAVSPARAVVLLFLLAFLGGILFGATRLPPPERASHVQSTQDASARRDQG